MAISSIHSAYSGIQSGFQGLQQNAQQIASSRDNYEKPMVEMTQNKEQVQASAKALKTADEMIGSLLDIRA